MTTNDPLPDPPIRLAPLWRRLVICLYDGLLWLATLWLAGLLWLGLARLTGSTAAIQIVAGDGHDPIWTWTYTLYLLCVSFAYFGWFWTHGGQTLGLRTWRCRVVDAAAVRRTPIRDDDPAAAEDQRPRRLQSISWPQAAVRFAVAIVSWSLLGLGFLWMLIDRQRTWHDRASGSLVIWLPTQR